MGKKKAAAISVERLDYEDEYIDESDSMDFIDYSDSAIASFCFTEGTTFSDKAMQKQQPLINNATQTAPAVKAANSEELPDNRTLRTQPNGITPPVDGEYFEVRRTFLFRRSTVRMLNRLKAEHADENAYLSSIVDEALRFYYSYIFEKSKNFK